MELIQDTCFWCRTRISRSSINLAWLCDYESSDCDSHPVSFDLATLKPNGELAPHQTRKEVYAIIRRNHYIELAQRSGKYIREVDDNVVLISKKARKTSRNAAKNILPHTGTIRRKVYDTIASHGYYGATDFALEKALNGKHQTISSLRRSLVIDGYVVDSGRTRINETGNECTVWVVKESQTQETLFGPLMSETFSNNV